jgi:hypothetical protein
MVTSEPATSPEEAYEHVGYYMRRWKTERFHYALKSGRAIEKAQERSIDKTMTLILMYSIIAAMTLNMTYAARLTPRPPCSLLLEKEDRKEPKKPYTIKEAVDCLGWLGRPKRAPSDGHPGVKTIWIGLMKLHILLACREYLA